MNMSRVNRLLHIIETRSNNAFQKFVSLLHKEKQSGAVESLTKTTRKPVGKYLPENVKDAPIFVHLPSDLEGIIDKSLEPTYIVLESLDPNLSIRRFQDIYGHDKVKFKDIHNLTNTDHTINELLRADLNGFYGKIDKHNFLITRKDDKYNRYFTKWLWVQERVKWSHFSECGQNILLKRELQFQGRALTLEDVCKIITKLTNKTLVHSLISLDDMFLVQLYNNQRPEISSGNIPSVPKHYVPRTLIYRSRISRRVLNITKFSTNNDVFVFYCDGLPLYELMSFVKRHGDGECSTSGDEMKIGYLSTSAILLDTWSDFDKICEKRYDKPVHLLECIREEDKNGSILELHWLETRGSISSILEYVHESQAELQETSFQHSSVANTVPLCISDSPGMGKSCLLSSCAHNIKYQHKHKNDVIIVQYVIFNDVIQELQHLFEKFSQLRTEEYGLSSLNPPLTKDVVRSVVQNCSKYDLGKKLLSAILFFSKGDIHKVLNGYVKLEIFFDGVDEINPDFIPAAQFILTTFKNLAIPVRVWVATRPHLLNLVECTLCVLGFNLRGFNEDDQLTLLTKYWISESDITYSDMENVAKRCLLKLKEKVSRDGSNIVAGIPLLCQLLAEIYKQDAQEICRYKKRDTLERQINDMTISNLYQRYVEKRYFDADDKKHKVNTLRNHYITKALTVTFPGISVANIFTDGYTITDKEILRYGILEAKSYQGPLTFIHSSFADFFVAEGVKYVIEFLDSFNLSLLGSQHFLSNSVCTSLLYKYIALVSQILSVQRSRIPFSNVISGLDISVIKFQNPNISYFTNLTTSSIHIETNVVAKFIFFFYPNDVNEFADSVWRRLVAATFANYHHLSVFLIKFLKAILPDDRARNSFFVEYPENKLNDLIFIAAKFSSYNLMREICQLAKLWHKKRPISKYVLRPYRHSNFSFQTGSIFTPIHAALESGNSYVASYLLLKQNFKCIINQNLDVYKFLLHFLLQGSIHNSFKVVKQKQKILEMFFKEIPDLIVNFKDLKILLEQVHLDLLLFFLEFCHNHVGHAYSSPYGIVVNRHGENMLHLLGNGHYEENISPTKYHFALVEINKLEEPNVLKTHLEATNCFDWRAVDVAVSYIDLLEETLELFTKLGIRFDVPDFRGSTTLFKAVAGQRDDIFLQNLIDRKATWGPKYRQETILHVAAAYLNYPAMKLFISLKKENAIAKNIDGDTPLHLCFRRENKHIKGQRFQNLFELNLSGMPGISVLKKFQGVVNITDNSLICNSNKFRITNPFVQNFEREPNNHHKIVSLLLDNGAQISQENNKGVTPLHLAIDICLEGLNKKERSSLKKNIYHLFKEKEHLTLALKGLLCNPNIGYKWHPSLILSFADAIRKNGGDVYWRNKTDKSTLLHLAARKHSLYGVKYLIEKANISANLVDGFNNTPLKFMFCTDNCSKLNCSKIRKYLLEKAKSSTI